MSSMPSLCNGAAANMQNGKRFSRSNVLQGGTQEECWFDLDQFYEDHINEVLPRLCKLDDEIWGKVVLMERNKRTAKAYLRTTSVIVDAGNKGFDGKSVGFNSFPNAQRDSFASQIKAKIGAGVAIRIDEQGSVAALARGTAPVFCQGWRHPHTHCMPNKLASQRGRLEPADPARLKPDKDRAVKIFDMKLFKQSLANAADLDPMGRRHLLYKTCIRLALVKDGPEPIRTPCWFMLINLVALDMLQTKFASISEVPRMTGGTSILNGPLSRATSHDSLASIAHLHRQHSGSDIYGSLMGHLANSVQHSANGIQGDSNRQPMAAHLGPLLAAAFGAGPYGSAPHGANQILAQLTGAGANANGDKGQLSGEELAAQLAALLQLRQHNGAATNQHRKSRLNSGYASESDLLRAHNQNNQQKTRQKSAGRGSKMNKPLNKSHWANAAGYSTETIYEPVSDGRNGYDTDQFTDNGDTTTENGSQFDMTKGHTSVQRHNGPKSNNQPNGKAQQIGQFMLYCANSDNPSKMSADSGTLPSKRSAKKLLDGVTNVPVNPAFEQGRAATMPTFLSTGSSVSGSDGTIVADHYNPQNPQATNQHSNSAHQQQPTNKKVTPETQQVPQSQQTVNGKSLPSTNNPVKWSCNSLSATSDYESSGTAASGTGTLSSGTSRASSATAYVVDLGWVAPDEHETPEINPSKTKTNQTQSNEMHHQRSSSPSSGEWSGTSNELAPKTNIGNVPNGNVKHAANQHAATVDGGYKSVAATTKLAAAAAENPSRPGRRTRSTSCTANKEKTGSPDTNSTKSRVNPTKGNVSGNGQRKGPPSLADLFMGKVPDGLRRTYDVTQIGQKMPSRQQPYTVRLPAYYPPSLLNELKSQMKWASASAKSRHIRPSVYYKAPPSPTDKQKNVTFIADVWDY